MAGLPQFKLSTQVDPYWEIPFFDAEMRPLGLDGRVFEAWVTPASTAQGIAPPPTPVKVLTLGNGLSIVPPTDGSGDQTIRNTFVHLISRDFAQANMPRGELTADIIEVVGASRRLLMPVRLYYNDPAALREYASDRAGVVFGPNRQPIITPVAVAGQVGARGAGFLTGSGPPAPANGEDGDYWIDAASDPRQIYGPKAEGAWPTTGEPITSSLTPALEAARDDAVAAAAETAEHAQATGSDRLAVDLGATQVEIVRQAVVQAQGQVAADRAFSGDARAAAIAARDVALAAQASAQIQSLAAQSAASDVDHFADLLDAAAYDFSFDSAESNDDDWSN